ncbi:MAG: hypothetical protein ACYYK0_06340 [Candidatus Eutrophobiaceae bacterium]
MPLLEINILLIWRCHYRTQRIAGSVLTSKSAMVVPGWIEISGEGRQLGDSPQLFGQNWTAGNDGDSQWLTLSSLQAAFRILYLQSWFAKDMASGSFRDYITILSAPINDAEKFIIIPVNDSVKAHSGRAVVEVFF